MKKFIKAKQILVFLCICYCNLSLSQTQEQKRDSTKSTLQNLDDFSQKSKFGKLVHRLLVKPNRQPKTNSNLTQRQNYMVISSVTNNTDSSCSKYFIPGDSLMDALISE